MLRFASDPVNQIKRKTFSSIYGFDGIAHHVAALRLVFARFDTRQIGPRLPAPAGATAAKAGARRLSRPFDPQIGPLDRFAPAKAGSGLTQTGAPRFTNNRSATHPLLAALRRPAIGSGVPPPGDRLSDPRTPVAVPKSKYANRFHQSRNRIHCTNPLGNRSRLAHCPAR